MVFSTDDLSVDNLQHFCYWDLAKKRNPGLKVLAFTIAEGLPCKEFDDWFMQHKDWVEIGVHCYNHDKPQEGWRDDQEYWIKKALDVLTPYLPEKFIYRPPGFRFLPKTEGILKKLGFAGIAHQDFIKYFNTGELVGVCNTHCTYDKFVNPIGQIWNQIKVI